MVVRRINPNRVKLHRAYTVVELAERLGVHKNSIRNWQRDGLKPVDGGRPLLFQGTTVRDFLAVRNAGRKRPCPPGTLYCFRCREPRTPALRLVEYEPMTATSGNLRAFCASCESVMHRRVRKAAVASVLPNCEVQLAQAVPRLSGSSSAPLNCDLEGQVTA